MHKIHVIILVVIGVLGLVVGVRLLVSHQETRPATGETFVLHGKTYRFEADITKINNWWMGQFKEVP